MRKYLVEFIGTFFLVLTVCMVVRGGLGNFAPLAIAAVLTAMIYAGGHISGAHFNPAVTISIYLRGKLPASDIIPYIIAQVLAALIAALLSKLYFGDSLASEAPPAVFNLVPALVGEFIGTFGLCYVILHVATAKGTAGNSFYGLAIGITVLGMAYVFGSFSGGAFNPAVATGISLAGIVAWSNFWIYLLACFLAGATAAFVFKFVNGPE